MNSLIFNNHFLNKGKNHYFVWLLVFFITSCIPSVKDVNYKPSFKICINEEGSNICFSVYRDSKRVKPNFNKVYHWYGSGCINKTKGNFEGQLLNGEYTAYYKSGKLKEKGLYNIGIRCGKWFTWNEDGTIQKVAEFDLNNYYKKLLIYSDSGQLIKRVQFDNNNKIKKSQTLDLDGKINYIIKYENGIIRDTIFNKKQKPS
jgi:hypothetical protein